MTFPIGDEDRLGALDRARDARPMQAPHQRTRHDKAPFRCVDGVEDLSKVIEGVILDRHRVSAGRGRDVDADRIHVGASVRIADCGDQRRDRRRLSVGHGLKTVPYASALWLPVNA